MQAMGPGKESILREIFEHKQREVEEQRRRRPLHTIRRAAEQAGPGLDFVSALRGRQRPALIAEVKQASPSRGVLAPNFDPLALAQIYRDHGAAAISVLTDERYFQGSLDFLRRIANLDGRPPLLRKDFLFDEYQLYEARAAGADAVLLIAAQLEPGLLSDLHALTLELGMAPLVEVHNRSELDLALACNPNLLGVNNRNLHTFRVDLNTTLAMRPHIPEQVCLVAESGIHYAEDVQRLRDAGVDAILVGEALVTAADTAAKVRELAGIQEPAGQKM